VYAEDKMKSILNCPICKKEIYSEIGKGCQMCGMALENQEKEFCCNICKKQYRKIHKQEVPH